MTLVGRVGSESGQSLIIVALAMTLILALAAFSIDVAQWQVGRHKAQVTADATALAAANCLASLDCNSFAVDSGKEAQQTGYAIALDNGYPQSEVTIVVSGSAVKATIKNSVSSSFAGLFGMPSENVSASAVASYTTGTSSTCSTPGNSCAAVFAMGQSCSTSDTAPGGSPIIFGGSGDTITGQVHSNGSIYEAGGGQQTLGPTTFGNGSTGGTACQIAWSNESGDTWDGSSTKPTTGEAALLTWPDDYTQVVTPCGSGYSYACTGPDGTPSYCTEATTSTAGYAAAAGAPTFDTANSTNGEFVYGSTAENPPSGQVWCAVGTGTASDPGTWNGWIYLESDSISVTGNWIGGSIELGQNGWTLSPKLSSFPVLYATGASGSSSTDCTKKKTSSAGWVCMDGGNEQITGSIFAPAGWIEYDGGGSGATDSFLEAQGVYFDGGSSIIGDGPTSLTGGPPTPGSDTLTG